MKRLRTFWLALLPWSALLAAPVSDEAMLESGRARLYLQVSGPSADAPLLLFLHGGPGSVAHLVMFQATVGRQLEMDFLVAYLHQRGVGRSAPVSASEQTLSAHVADVAAAVNYLQETYGQSKVILVGHSWGGMLAGAYAVQHRDDVARLVLISTGMDVSSLLRDSYERAVAWSLEVGHQEAITELASLDGSFDAPRDFMATLEWANQAGGIASDFDFDAFLDEQDVNIDYPGWGERQAAINRTMVEEVLNINLTTSFASLNIPVLFVSGRRDTIVTETTMRRDFENYRGEKAFVLLEDSHHLPFIDQPEELAVAIREQLYN